MIYEDTKKFKKDLDALLLNSKRIIITSHLSPDDDAISSMFLLYFYCKNILKLDIPIIMASSDIKSDRWENFPLYHKIKFDKDISKIIKETDTLLIADVKDYHRISKLYKNLKIRKFKSICIDHHITEVRDTFDMYLSYPTVNFTSNAELLYSLLLKDNVF